MTIRHMKIFLQVYQLMSITQAAQKLHMTQPAVTRAVKELESYYGIRLFDRISKRLYVTEAGQQFYAQALHIVDAFETMETGLRNWDQFGIIRVGASVTLGNFLLPGLVSRFRKTYPEIRVRASVSNGGNLEQALLNNELDLALIEGAVGSLELHTERVGEDHLALITPCGHPLLIPERLLLRDVLQYPVLLREKGSTARAFLDHCFAARDMQVTPMWESISTQAIVKAVACGIGVSFLPEQLARPCIETGDISTRFVEDADFTRQHYLVWHKNKYLTGSMQNFIQLCMEPETSLQ